MFNEIKAYVGRQVASSYLIDPELWEPEDHTVGYYHVNGHKVEYYTWLKTEEIATVFVMITFDNGEILLYCLEYDLKFYVNYCYDCDCMFYSNNRMDDLCRDCLADLEVDQQYFDNVYTDYLSDIEPVCYSEDLWYEI